MIKKILPLLFLFSALIVSAQAKKKVPIKYWEELTEKEKTAMLNDSAPAKNISDLYNGKYYFSGSKDDEALFKSLTSTSNTLVPLRVFLMSRLVSSPDSLVKKLLEEYSVKMAFNQPDVLMRSFCKEHLKKKDVYKNYVPFFAADLDEKIEYQNWNDFLTLYFIGANAETRQMLSIIFKECEKAGAGSKNAVPPAPLPPKGKDD